jgi:protein SCO1/2
MLAGGCGGASTTGSPTPAQPATATQFDGAPIPPTPAPPFTLTDQNGRRVSLTALRGHVVMLSFLYTHCGATCDVIAQQIRGSLDELTSPVPVLIVTAQPAGDTPASIRAFLARASLTGRVHYLTGPPAELARLWSAYRVRPASAGQAVFDSYAFVMLIDPRGQERVLFESEELTPESLTHDIRVLERG